VADEKPFLKIVKGDASAEEIAALVAALAAVAAARSNAGGSEPGPVRDNWSSRARLLRSPVRPAADGWRRSALP
jgi:hypothetical protein